MDPALTAPSRCSSGRTIRTVAGAHRASPACSTAGRRGGGDASTPGGRGLGIAAGGDGLPDQVVLRVRRGLTALVGEPGPRCGCPGRIERDRAAVVAIAV